jgi:glycosyltransferase involved in cell wall biosynthesis
MPKLTVLIPCKDERENIAECIASVRMVADEILVADSGSSDGTQEIVRRLGGCRLIEREFVSYADFKNWAIPQAANPWVLVVDADERLTADLAAEIRQILAGEPGCDAYALRRQNFFLGQPIRHCGWNQSYVTRLLRRSVCRYRLCRVHEEIDLPPDRIGRLNERLLHYTCTDFDKFLFKQVKYSLFSAEDRFERRSRVGLATLLLHGPLRFLQLYLLRGGFLDGLAGLVICTLMAYYAFLKDAKLWSLHVTDDSGQTPQLSQKTHVPAKAA